MRTKIVVLIAAIALGVLAAIVSVQYIESARAKVSEEDEPVEVLVAQQDLSSGLTSDELANEEYLQLVTVPRRYVAEGAISSMASIQGQVLTVSLTKGEQVTKARFSLPTAAGLSFAVPDSHVAVALPNDAVRGVAGLIRPGDHVAVYATFEPDGGLEEAVTKLLLEKVRVLAVGVSTTAVSTSSTKASDKEGDGGLLASDVSGSPEDVPGTITLALSPADAERIVFAQEEGKIWLALIGSGTTEVPSTPGQRYPDVIE